MIIDAFLVVNSRGSVKINKNKPDLSFNEIAISLQLKIPDSLFKKPAIHATLTIPEDKVAPMDITIDTLHQIEELVYRDLGIQIKLIDKTEEGENIE